MKIENRKKLGDVIKEYKEKNTDNKYKPVAVGRYGIRKREDIYSKELAKDYSKNKLIYKNTLTVGMGSIGVSLLRLQMGCLSLMQSQKRFILEEIVLIRMLIACLI